MSTPFTALARSWWVLLLYGLVGVAFGIAALVRPLDMALAMVWVMGVFAVADGLVAIVALFDKASAAPKGWLAFYALASIAFGAVAILSPGLTATVLLLFVAAWLVVGGLFRIVFAIRVRKAIEGEWMIALSGLLVLALGVLFALSPMSGLAVTTLWIGAFALVFGVLQVVAAFRLRKLAA